MKHKEMEFIILDFKLLKVLEDLRKKKSRNINRLAFLKRCRDFNLTPTFAKLHNFKRKESLKKILQKAEIAIVRDQITETRFTLHQIDHDLVELEQFLATSLQEDDWRTINRLTQTKAENVHKKTKETQVKKFNNLKVKQNNNFYYKESITQEGV